MLPYSEEWEPGVKREQHGNGPHPESCSSCVSSRELPNLIFLTYKLRGLELLAVTVGEPGHHWFSDWLVSDTDGTAGETRCVTWRCAGGDHKRAYPVPAPPWPQAHANGLLKDKVVHLFQFHIYLSKSNAISLQQATFFSESDLHLIKENNRRCSTISAPTLPSTVNCRRKTMPLPSVRTQHNLEPPVSSC